MTGHEDPQSVAPGAYRGGGPSWTRDRRSQVAHMPGRTGRI